MNIHTPQDIQVLSEKRGFKQAAQRALVLAYEIALAPNGKRRVRHDILYRHAGQPNKAFGRYFHTFFTRSGRYIPGERSFDYSITDGKLERLERHAFGDNHTTNAFATACQAKGKTFLLPPSPRDALPRTDDRVYPWWAMMRKEWRRKLFLEEHGVMWDYDISNSKPTLLLQAYDRLKGPREGRLETWRWYVQDKNAVRQQLMDDMGWTKDRTKDALQAICNGAWVAKEGSLAGQWDLAKHKIYIGLREDFNTMWNVFSRLRVDGEKRGATLSREYGALEDKVMGVISEILDPAQECWWIHDGWITKTPVSTDDLKARVKQKTGLTILIEEEGYPQ